MSDVSLHGLRVLVIEDEYLIALDVEELCREHGAAEVRIVRTLDEAQAELSGSVPLHAAILDMMIDGQRTIGIAQVLRDRSIPFVFATGYTQDAGLFEGFDEIAVVPKPYAGRDLLAALSEAIERGRQASSGV